MHYIISLMGQEYMVFWTALLVLFTAALVFFAYFQLRGIKKTTRADFVHRFKQDIFKEPIQQIVMLLQYSALNFRIRDISFGEGIPTKDWPYFEIDTSIADQLKESNINKAVYNSYEIDDNLLGHFEDLGNFEKYGILDISFIYNWFNFYIEMTWDNNQIKKYINWLREGNESSYDIYENFEYIYNKCKSYGEAKRMNKWIWVWKLKWLFCQLY